MKKAIYLLLAFILGLSLCACGNATMTTEEALKLCPTIVGNWDTDFFDASPVLVISEDGSCLLMGEAGTWALDAKTSTSTSATLHITTESNGKYQATMDVPRDYEVVRECYLSITNTKQDATIFSDRVINQSQSVVSPQDVLSNIPELEGEWGSPYFAEDSVATFRNDGTCTLLGKEGVWGGRKGLILSSEGTLVVRTEDGVEYTVLCFMYERGGFFSCDIIIRTEEDVVSDAQLCINRSAVVDVLDVAPMLVGTWTETGKDQPYAVFYEDGTCTLSGAEGVWGLYYMGYYNEKYRNGFDYCYVAKTAEGNWDISINEHEDGTYTVSVLNPDTGLHLIPFLNSEKTSS